MIIVVCLNPALDITYHVPGVDWTGVNRPGSVYSRPGGKGLNVGRTLHSLGADVLIMGLAGGLTGAEVVSALGVPSDFIPIGGATRRTVTVVDEHSGEAATFNEPGPLVSAAEFGEFAARYGKTASRSAAVVLSGSLPPGLPTDTYATLIEMAEVPVVLDTHGDALLRGAAAGPAIVKPNLAELGALTGRSLSAADRSAVADAAGQLRGAGARAVVATLGADGVLAATDAGSWHAFPPAAVAGNPTGAGDAVAAGLAHGVVLGLPWQERLRHAVALGTASAAAPVAGEFSPDHYASLVGAVKVRDLLCRWRRCGRSSSRAGGSARSTSSVSSTPRRSSPGPRRPELRSCSRSARTAFATMAPWSPSAAPAWPSRTRPRCPWRCIWTTLPAARWSGRRRGSAWGR